MSKRVPVNAIDASGQIVASFSSIAAACGAGHCHTSINRSLYHGRVVEGLRWVRANKAPPLSIDRLEAVASRLEAVAERIERKA
jgi:hypothetical protein